MHELSLSSAIVNTATKHAAGRRVTVVSLRVGQLRQVVPDTLEFYFEFVARGEVEIELERVHDDLAHPADGQDDQRHLAVVGVLEHGVDDRPGEGHLMHPGAPRRS